MQDLNPGPKVRSTQHISHQDTCEHNQLSKNVPVTLNTVHIFDDSSMPRTCVIAVFNGIG